MSQPSSPILTPRQTEALLFARDGLSDKEIGRRMGIERATVKNILTHARERLSVNSRTQAVVRAIKLGLIPLW